jgi:transcription antitermination factor NusG
LPLEGTWAVAITELYQQEKVIEQFIARGFDYFFPRVRRAVRHKGRRIQRLDPLLYNYLPVVLSDGWGVIFDMRGVVDIIGPANSGQIEALKRRCDASDILIPEPMKPTYKPGQAVKPIDGLLAGHTGRYIGLSNDDRDIVLFTILGARRSIKFELGALVAA